MRQTCFNSLASGAILAALLALAAGCAEPLTYSQDFKHDGLAQYNRGDYIKAAGSFREAAKQNPADYQTQYYLGLSEEKNANPHAAIEAYRLCLKLRPQFPAGRADLAMRERVLGRLAPLIARGDFPDAEINAIAAEAQNNHSAEDFRLLARIHAIQGDADSAVAAYKSGFTFSPEDFPIAREYGLYLVKLDQNAEALRVLKQAWQLDSTDKQVSSALRQLGYTDAQLAVRTDRIEKADAVPAASGQTAWDASVAAPQ